MVQRVKNAVKLPKKKLLMVYISGFWMDFESRISCSVIIKKEI